jgi:hypothetical protein
VPRVRPLYVTTPSFSLANKFFCAVEARGELALVWLRMSVSYVRQLLQQGPETQATYAVRPDDILTAGIMGLPCPSSAGLILNACNSDTIAAKTWFSPKYRPWQMLGLKSLVYAAAALGRTFVFSPTTKSKGRDTRITDIRVGLVRAVRVHDQETLRPEHMRLWVCLWIAQNG